MKKLVARTLLAAVAALLVFGVVTRANPELRTQAYYGFKESWRTHWPFERGRFVYNRLQPLFQPLEPAWFEVAPGVQMRLDPEDLVARYIIDHREWEPETWRALEAHLEPGDVFVDVGSHIGYFALKAAHRVGDSGRSLAVEPNPATVERLRANVARSKASNVEVFPVACSDTEAELELFAASEANTGMSSLSERTAGLRAPIQNTYRVRARPLDDIVGESGVERVDAIKVDVEGAELLVLKGAQRTLTEHSPLLILEMRDEHLRAMGTSIAEITELLGSMGYAMQAKVDDNATFVKQAFAAVSQTATAF